MKYIKRFESKKDDKILYDNSEFKVFLSGGLLISNSTYLSTSAIFGLIVLIKYNSEILNDNNLRDIKVPETDKDFIIDTLSLDDDKIANLLKFRSGAIRHFLDMDLKTSKELNVEVYKMIILKYYPIIKSIIKLSETLGDVIDEFKKINNEISDELPLLINSNKYNL